MVFPARRSQKIHEPGFTLLELLLVVVLLLGLLSAVVFNFATLKTGAHLDEGARQFEALIRFSAAAAANSGRTVQFRFDSLSTNDIADATLPLRIVREVDPIGQPGVFEDLPEALPMLATLLDHIRVSAVKSAERPPNQGTNEFAVAEEMARTAPVSFFPDGSSDTVDISLASSDPDDVREMVIHLSGVTGAIRTEIKHFDEWLPDDLMDDTTAQASDSRAEPTQPAFDDTTSTNHFSNEDRP